MDVRLPNGQVVANVPEGTTQSQLLDRLAQGGYDVAPLQKQIGPVATPGVEGLEQAAKEVGESDQSVVGQIKTGLGTAGQRMLAGIGGITDYFTPDIIKNFRKERLGLELPSEESLKVAKATREGAGRGALAADIIGSIAGTIGAPSNVLTAGATRLGSVLGTAGTSALVAGATTPGNIAERGKDAALAAGLSTAVPGVLAAAQGVRRGATQAGRELGSAETLRREIGAEASENLVGQLRAPYPNAPLGVAPTAAMKTQNPTLQAFELGARTKRGDLFSGVDEANALARWEALQKIAKDDAAMNAAVGQRASLTNEMREGAINIARRAEGAGLPAHSGIALPVWQRADDLLSGPQGSNPAVASMAHYVQRELEKGGDPARLQVIRHTLTDGIPHGTELGNAIKAARKERTQMVAAIDDALDSASQGEWSRYLRTYQRNSQPVTSMKAGQAIAETFEHTPARTSTATGSVPLMTPAALSRAVERHGEKQFGTQTLSRVTDEERRSLNMLIDDLRRQQDVMKARGITGSDTAAKIAAGSRGDAVAASLIGHAIGKVSPVPGVGALLDAAVSRGMARRREEALAEILKDPAKLADLLQQSSRASTALRIATEPSRVLRVPTE